MGERETKKILVVDDDYDLCKMLMKLLGRKGYEADYVLSGEEALERVYKEPFDLIILDIMMPGIDGYEVCHKLKIHREYNRIPILMLSAKDTEQDKIVGLQTGADDYIFKPFEVGELLRAMEEVLRRHEAIFTNGLMQEVTFNFQSQFEYLEEVNELVTQLFRHTTLAADEVWEIKLALHEVGINAIEHGNKMDPEKSVRLRCRIFGDRIEFDMEDQGEGFAFRKLPDPTEDAALARERGRGIYLVSKIVDEVRYDGDGSRVRLIKHLNGAISANSKEP